MVDITICIATMPYLLESLNHHLFKVGVRRYLHVFHSIEAQQSGNYLKLPYRSLEVKLKCIRTSQLHIS